MTGESPALTCPDCDDPVTFAFGSTSGVGAHKRGDAFNTTPDTTHYLCFPCGRAWKQRLDGRLTPDVVGELAFFTCRDHACGASMTVTASSDTAAGTELTCAQGHRFIVVATEDGLTLEGRG